MFETMKFHEATYWPSSEAKPFIDYQAKAVPETCIVKVCEWVSAELRRAPVLMFVNAGEDAKTVDGVAAPFFEIKDRTDFANLRSLDKADHKGYHQLIVATTEEEMRGVDLRAHRKIF